MATSTHTSLRRPALPLLALLVALIALLAAGPTSALARGGNPNRPEVRVRATCSRGASATLKLKADDSGIEAEFEVDNNRRGTLWNVALVHERRRVWSGNRRTGGPSGSFTVRRAIPNFPGADEVFARAIGPRGVTCRATAILPA